MRFKHCVAILTAMIIVCYLVPENMVYSEIEKDYSSDPHQINTYDPISRCICLTKLSNGLDKYAQGGIDTIYTNQALKKIFQIPHVNGRIKSTKLRLSILADDNSNDTSLYKLEINGESVPVNFTHALPKGGPFTNWKTVEKDIDPLDISKFNSIEIKNSSHSLDERSWFAVNKIELVLEIIPSSGADINSMFDFKPNTFNIIYLNENFDMIEPKFDIAHSFKGGLAEVNCNNKLNFIDRAGNIVIENKKNRNDFSKDGLGIYIKDQKIGFVDKSGKVVIKPQFQQSDGFSEGMSAVLKDGKWGFIDKTGKFAYSPIVARCYNFSGGFAKIFDGKKWLLMDKNGRFIVDSLDDVNGKFNEGLAGVKKNGKWGYVDKTGKFIIEPKFDYVRPFSEGLAAVRKDKYWGFIDTTGNFVIEPQYIFVQNYEVDHGEGFYYNFSNGLTKVVKSDSKNEGNQKDSSNAPPLLTQYIDRTGRVAFNALSVKDGIFSEGLAAVFNGTKWGFVDKTGKMVIEPRFDYRDWWDRGATPSFEEGLAAVSWNGKFGYLIDKRNALKLLINKKVIDMSDCVNEAGRLMVPVRGIFSELGISLSWNDSTKTVTAKKAGNTTLEITVGSKSARLNGKKINIDLPPRIVNGRTLVPLRFISESTGVKVNWDESSKTIRIDSD